jgi:hypothetical protein
MQHCQFSALRILKFSSLIPKEAFTSGLLKKNDFDVNHADRFFKNDYADANPSCQRIFLFLFGDVVFEHFKLRSNLASVFTPAEYFKYLTNSNEGMLIALLKVQGCSMTGLFDVHGNSIWDETPAVMQTSNCEQDNEDDESTFSAVTSHDGGSSLNENSEEGSNSDNNSKHSAPKKGKRKPKMDCNQDKHEQYSRDSFLRRELILKYCVKNVPRNDEDNDDEESFYNKANQVLGWYMKAIDKVTQLRSQVEAKSRKRKTAPVPQVEIIDRSVRTRSEEEADDWMTKQSEHVYENITAVPV